MIRGIHGLFYSSEPEAARAFIREKLKLPFTDTGEGWLIFDLPEGDVGIHPTDEKDSVTSGTHDVSFYCDKIHETVAQLRERGVEFTSEVADHGYGYVTYFTMPGGIRVQLYEPKYTKRQEKKSATRKRARKVIVKRKGRAAKKRGSR
jgi:predicted enzyme related to lactoylglutathione lyase